MGRLVPVKGIETLIEAASRLENTVTLIAGAGSRKKALEALACSKGALLRFLGTITGQEKLTVLECADLVVFPSIILPGGRTEGLPVSLLEALARGKAVIASQVGGIGQVISHGENGMLVPPGDPDALEQSMRMLLEDGVLRESLGKAARERAGEFSREKAGERFHELYDEAVKSCSDGVETHYSSLV
jgi:glycosyltransferase involved in cell wall biosynthesis